MLSANDWLVAIDYIAVFTKARTPQEDAMCELLAKLTGDPLVAVRTRVRCHRSATLKAHGVAS